MSNLAELKTALDSMQERIDSQILEITGKASENTEATKKELAELKSLLSDWDGVRKELDGLKLDVTQIMQKGVQIPEAKADITTVGQDFVNSPQFKAFIGGEAGRVRVESKNTILVGTGNTVSRHDQMAGVVPGAFRMLTVMPTIDNYSTSSNVMYYSRELLWTNAAAGQVEGNAKAESTLTFEEVTTAIRTVAHFIKVSRQALDDSEFLSSYMDRRMRHGVNNKIEDQIINGDGTGQNFSGWDTAGNHTVTSALATGDIYGLANKMKYEIIAADYAPDFFYMNPSDWATAETQRRGAGDDAFVAASGAVSYVNNGLTPLLWGLPVVLSNNVTAGDLWCKSRDADGYADRSGTVVEMFEQDDTNVQSNLVTVRAEARGASLNFTPAAIRKADITTIT